jgi:deoxycytidine triphosphate deaminase
MKIGQITFEKIDGQCERPYGSEGLNSKYKGDMKVQGSKMYREYFPNEK